MGDGIVRVGNNGEVDRGEPCYYNRPTLDDPVLGNDESAPARNAVDLQRHRVPRLGFEAKANTAILPRSLVLPTYAVEDAKAMRWQCDRWASTAQDYIFRHQLVCLSVTGWPQR